MRMKSVGGREVNLQSDGGLATSRTHSTSDENDLDRVDRQPGGNNVQNRGNDAAMDHGQEDLITLLCSFHDLIYHALKKVKIYEDLI